jgi:nucleoside 2-deoxyribosyltransferase
LEKLKKHKLVYLATVYSKCPHGIEWAFREASRTAAHLLQEGVSVFSPIAHTHPIAIYGGLDPYDHAIWLPFDQAMMDACDAMVVGKMQGWTKSVGIAHEIRDFTKKGKPIYGLDPETLEVTDWNESVRNRREGV